MEIGNTSFSMIVGMGDVCIKINIGCMLTLKDLHHALDLHLNLKFGLAID